MHKKSAAIIGATGLTGSCVQRLLLANPGYDRICSLVRRPVKPAGTRHEIKPVDFNDPESILRALKEVSVVFCAIGTTNKKVNGDHDLYRQVDYDIPVRVCNMAMEAGCSKFVLVSSAGANPKSSNFYLRLKGQTEDAVIATGMPAVHIMRPGQLMGKRTERRPVEAVARQIMKPLSALFFGSWAQYKAIEAATVAKAMIAAAAQNGTGVFRYTYHDIMRLANQESR